ncbi:MAG: nitrate reductase [Burkholderiales bacterium]|jgi:nitrate reductase gamma subunit|nr:nitrate reductase [Burkholderiales bacterium]
MELLEFARGPALAFSVAVFALGLAWRLYRIFRHPMRADHSEPRRRDLAAGGLRAVFVKMLPPRGVKVRGPAMANAYAYHVALALIAFTFAPHIGFIARYTGIAWPALPDAVTYVATAVAIVGLLIALLARLTDPVLRLLSRFDDYFSWAVTMAPLVTGMALLPMPAQPVALAVHLLSLELLFVWLPFGKLAHAVLVFVSRWRTGVDFARKGAAV